MMFMEMHIVKILHFPFLQSHMNGSILRQGNRSDVFFDMPLRLRTFYFLEVIKSERTKSGIIFLGVSINFYTFFNDELYSKCHISITR